LLAHQRAEAFVLDRIAEIQSQLNDLREGIASDSKSTAGDKHETGRAMAQLEQEQLAAQLLQMQQHLQSIQQAGRMRYDEKINFGSFVKTNKGAFYLSTGIGSIPGDDPFFCLSIQTPMGQALQGKIRGESFVFNGQSIEILAHF
jgi:transcription elongation GreA/GreB family factor